MRGAKVAECDSRSGVRDNDASVAESDEGDEEADASADCGVELMGDSCDKTLADAGEGEGEKDDSREKDGAESCLPMDTHAEDDGVGEVGVKAHAGSEG